MRREAAAWGMPWETPFETLAGFALDVHDGRYATEA